MTHLSSDDLQAGIFAALTSNADLTALVGGNVFDAPPTGDLPGVYVLLGEDRITDRSTMTSQANIHDIRVGVYSNQSGFLTAKQVANAVSTALNPNTIQLENASLVDFRFRSARAVRGAQLERRQIDLHFRAYIDAV